MKKILALLLALVLAGAMAACQKPAAAPTGSAIPLPGEEPESAPAPVASLAPLPAAGALNPFTGLPLAEGAAPGQRPLAIMIANDYQSLPQRGLAVCDVMLEALDERGGTSLMAMYGDPRTVSTVGPVRYTRDQFVQFAVPANAVLAHIGGSVYAKNLLNVLAYQDVDGIYVGTTTFVYDPVRGTSAGGNKRNEDNWFTDGALVAAGGAAVGLSQTGEVNTLFRFSNAPAPQGSTALDIDFYYNEANRVSFHYSPENNHYVKTAFGAPHADENGSQYLFQNVLLLYCGVGLKDDGITLEYNLAGGTGSLFAGGLVYPIQWKKGAPGEPLHILGQDGQELTLQTGKSYIGLLPEAQVPSLTYLDQAGRDKARAEAEAAAAQAAAEAAAAESAAAQAAAEAAAAAAASASPAPPPG